MDALALLCNLHADGPATLQRLRRLGCDSIEALASLDDARLGQELRRDEEAARRFKREACGLLERLKGSGTLRAAKPQKPKVEPQPASPAEPSALALPEPESTPPNPVPTNPVPPNPVHKDEKPSQRANVLRVLETWRVMDEVAAPASAEPSAPSPKPDQAPELRLDESELVGLTPALLDRLQGMGLETLGDFAEASSLELSKGLPMALTRVRRMQLLVRRMRIQRVLSTRDPNARDPADEPLRVLHPPAQVSELQGPSPGGASQVAERPELETEEQGAAAEPEQPSQERATALARSAEHELPGSGETPRERHPLEPRSASDIESDRFDSGGPFA